MAMTPERVTERIDALIESIRHGSSHAYAEHNARLTLDYIEHLHDLGIIDAAQFQVLVIAVNDVLDGWQPDPKALPWDG